MTWMEAFLAAVSTLLVVGGGVALFAAVVSAVFEVIDDYATALSVVILPIIAALIFAMVWIFKTGGGV